MDVKSSIAIGERNGGNAIMSVYDVNRQAAEFCHGVSDESLAALAGDDPNLVIDGLNAGYGKMEVLHNFRLRIGRAQSLCLIGPNGAGKSTVLHSIYGLANIFSGCILVGDGAQKTDITRLDADQKLRRVGIAYVLQDKSVFPDMTV